MTRVMHQPGGVDHLTPGTGGYLTCRKRKYKRVRAPYYPSRQESRYFSSLLHEVIRSQSGRTGFLDMSKGRYPSIDFLWQAAS